MMQHLYNTKTQRTFCDMKPGKYIRIAETRESMTCRVCNDREYEQEVAESAALLDDVDNPLWSMSQDELKAIINGEISDEELMRRMERR